MSVNRALIVALVVLFGCTTAPEIRPETRTLAGETDAEADSGAAIRSECFLPSLPAGAAANLIVNGNPLDSEQARNIAWIRRCVVEHLPGNSDARAELAAEAAWWALREGILARSPEKLFSYSNCHEGGKDRNRTSLPTFVCPDRNEAWQVGVAAAQVPNYSLEKIRATIDRIFPGVSNRPDETALLRWTALLGGFPEDSAAYRSILRSKDRLRRSWLLRNPLIGMVLVAENEVEGECFRDKRKWCFSGSYPDAKNFGPSYRAMTRAVGDLKKYFLGAAL